MSTFKAKTQLLTEGMGSFGNAVLRCVLYKRMREIIESAI